MTKLRSVNKDGYVWLVAVTAGGLWVWLHIQAKVGDCFRHGQRINPVRLSK